MEESAKLDIVETQLHHECKALYMLLLRQLKAAVPRLDASAWKETCLDIGLSFLYKCDTIINKLEVSRKELRVRKDDLYKKRQDLYSHTQKFGKDCQKELRSRVMEGINLGDRFENESLGSVDANLKQLGLCEMLKGVSSEARKYVMTEIDRFTSHLDATLPSKPSVVFIPKRAVLERHTLPLEVVGMIFSYCDLESCVALRGVSSSWYEAFNNSDFVLKEKMLERSPWMYPEADISSWADCVLVFVARLKNKKWKPIRQVSKFRSRMEEKPQHHVIAPELQLDDLDVLDYKADNLFYGTQKVTCTDTDKIMEYNNQTFILHPNTSIFSTPYPVVNFQHHTRVNIVPFLWFQKDKPLHYEHMFETDKQYF